MKLFGRGRASAPLTLIAWTFCGAWAFCGDAIASAAIKPEDEYNKRIHAAEIVSPLGSDAFGESVNLYDGSTEFSMVDIDLPSTGLPVQLRRRYRIDARIPEETYGYLAGFGDWSIDIPHIDGVFAANQGWKTVSANGYDRCSTPAIPATGGTTPGEFTDRVWDGYRINFPGRGRQELLVNTGKVPEVADGRTYPWLTTGLVKFRCAQSTKNGYPGESFIAIAPDGVEYTFDWVVSRQHSTLLLPAGVGWAGTPVDRTSIYMLVTHIQDRFGNWVNYTYLGDKLTRIEANDGRYIALTWTGDRITTAETSTGRWNYGYRAAPTGYLPATELSAVTLPDLSQWKYTAVGTRRRSKAIRDDDPVQHCQIDKEREPGEPYNYVIQAPSGASADFAFGYRAHWRNYIPLYCPFKAYDNGATVYKQPEVYAGFYQWSLSAKTISGPGLPLLQWRYSYGAPLGNYYVAAEPYHQNQQETYIPSGICSNCSVSKTTTVTSPDAVTQYVYGVQYARNEGRLLKVVTKDLSGKVLRFETTTFLAEASVSTQRFSGNIGHSLLPEWEAVDSARVRPVVSSAIVQDDWIFQKDILQQGGVYDFDVFARPTRQLQSNEAYIAPHPPALAPVLTVPSSSNTGNYSVAWQAVTDATQYILEEDGASLGAGDALSASISGKDNGTYSYRVKACNDVGCSAFSSTAAVTVSLAVPLTPTFTMYSDWDQTGVTITWTPVSAVRYELMQAPDAQSWVLRYSGQDPKFYLQQPNHTTYFYKVRACNNQTCGAYSTVHQINVDYERSDQ